MSKLYDATVKIFMKFYKVMLILDAVDTVILFFSDPSPDPTIEIRLGH